MSRLIVWGILIATILTTGCMRASPVPDAREPIVSPGQNCPPAPSFVLLVGGKPLGDEQVSGSGHYCGSIADGVASDYLKPLEVRPEEVVSLVYASRERWERVTYRVFMGQETVIDLPLSASAKSVTLPREPGTYTVSLQGKSRHGTSITYFKVTVSP